MYTNLRLCAGQKGSPGIACRLLTAGHRRLMIPDDRPLVPTETRLGLGLVVLVETFAVMQAHGIGTYTTKPDYRCCQLQADMFTPDYIRICRAFLALHAAFSGHG
jgi:hypothetical protein